MKSVERPVWNTALPLAPMLVPILLTPEIPAPAPSHRPGGRPFLAPAVTKSALPSPVKSPSAAKAAGAELKVTTALSPMLPPGDRLVTVRELVKRVGVMLMVRLPLVAGRLLGGPALSWYR
ncbi:hypothetical protein DRA43_02600 [Micromonospora provocatoris]|nr:hypothetical protein [Micromonospora provocatoris]RBJ10465.1 hypothetical protein DRA43_02600 [Micromonospora provocatoris]